MSRSVTFGERDKELIKKIEAYQREKDIHYFVEAVRQLCEKALKFNEITK